MQNPKQLENVKKLVMAGMKLMYSEQGREFLINGLNKKEPVSKKLSSEVLGVISMMFDRANQNVPPDAIPGAMAILIYEVASFMREAGVKVSSEDVQMALKMAMQNLIPMLRGLRQNKQQAPQGPQGQPQQGQPQQPPQPQEGQPPAGPPQGLINQPMVGA
jgi:hypothetical protein